jgi:hypothetical protein
MSTRPSQLLVVSSTTSAPASAATPASQRINTGWPVGDVILKELLIHIRSKLSANTSMTANGRKIFLRSLRFKTEKHGYVLDDIDGVMAWFMSWADQTMGQGHQSDVTNADGGTFMKFPFYDRMAYREEDTGLDLLRVARPELEIVFGNAADIEGTGGTTLSNLDVDVSVEIDPGRIDDPANDGPKALPYKNTMKIAITSTATAFQISLGYGALSIKRLFITQRNSSTLAIINNTIIGANVTDRISFKINGFPWVDGVRWDHIQNRNLMDYQKFDSTQGCGIIDAQRAQTYGGKVSESFNTVSPNNGRADLFIDATSVSNGALWIGFDSVRAIPDGAKRPTPAPVVA